MTTENPFRSTEALTDLVMSVVLTVVALYAYQSSYGGTEYLVIGVLGAVIAGAVVTALNVKKIQLLLSVAALFATYVVIGGVVGLHSQAIGGVFPSPTTMSAALEAVVTGWKELLTTVPPVGGVGNLLVLPFFCGCFGAGVSYLIARRLRVPLAAALAPAVVLGFGILAGMPAPVSVVMHGSVFIGVTLLWVALRHRRTRVVVQLSVADRRRRAASAVALVAIASTVGFATSSHIPLAQANDRVILRDTIDPPFDPFDYSSPLAGYRHYIKHLKTEVLFTIRGLPEGAPIRLAAMDQYDGVVWHVTGGANAERGASGYFERVGTTMQPQFEGEHATIEVSIQNWSEVWLPTVGEVISLRFEGPRARELNDAFRYSSAVDTAAVQKRILRPGDSYVMEVVLPTAGEDVADGQLVSKPAASAKDFVPEPLTTWVAPVVQKITLTFDRVTAVMQQLQNGYFSNGEENELDSLGGHSQGRLTAFVESDVMVGDAEQYAAAGALMLRSIDVSSRVVMGFIPKDYSKDAIEVTGDDTEAWVEVPVDGVGWVHFEPTPPETRTEPQEAPQPKPLPERNTQVPPPPPVLVDDPSSKPAKESEAQKDAEKAELPGAGHGISTVLVVVAVAVGAPFITLGVPIALVLYLKSRRRRRRMTSGSASERVANGFREVLDRASDLGRPIPRNSTRRELAGFIGTPTAPTLATEADELIFSPVDPDPSRVQSFWKTVDIVVRDMRRGVRRFDRWKASISLASLRSRGT